MPGSVLKAEAQTQATCISVLEEVVLLLMSRRAESAGAVREGSRGVVAPGAGERQGWLHLQAHRGPSISGISTTGILTLMSKPKLCF